MTFPPGQTHQRMSEQCESSVVNSVHSHFPLTLSKLILRLPRTSPFQYHLAQNELPLSMRKVVPIFIVSLLYKLPFLDFHSLYLDEAYSLFYAQQPLAELFKIFETEANPPLHFLSLHYWVGWFGVTAEASRLLSVICSSISCVLIFLLSERFFGKKAAWFTVVLFLFSGFHFLFAREGRGFAMAGMFCLASNLCLFALVHRQKSCCRRPLCAGDCIAVVHALSYWLDGGASICGSSLMRLTRTQWIQFIIHGRHPGSVDIASLAQLDS